MSWLLSMTFMWLIYFPILSFLKLLLIFVPKVRERMSFEKKNRTEPGARSFSKDGLKADLCFEFSSEGEYQQVASLIHDALSLGKKLELVFFSPSVEKGVLELYQLHQQQIRYLRYPILGLSFSSWVTSPQLILVRYDLFPEFLVWSLKKGRKLKFIWVTFKKERMKAKMISLFKRAFLQRSDFVVFATEEDFKLGQDLGIQGVIYDFRMEQIKRRMDLRLEKFSKIFPLYLDFKLLLDAYPRGKRLILGNAWPIDLDLIKDIPHDVLLVIVPHKLQPEIIEEMKQKLDSFGRTAAIISDTSLAFPVTQTILLNKKGILCELYADFGKAYIGGGFGVSIHSVLEPLVAGSETISCGPMNHRSTEFDVAKNLGQIKEVKNSQEFMQWLSEDISGIKVHDRIGVQIAAYPKYQKEILSC